MDCLNCDNDNHSTREYSAPDYTEKELKQMLKERKETRRKERLVEGRNRKIYKRIEKLKKKLK